MAVTEDTRPEVRAVAKWVRISPRKARLVTAHIRGRTVPEARTILAFTQRAAAREVEKVLRSAVANAESNHGLVGDELVVDTAVVDEGVTLKRWRPQARGRAHRIRKRTCHITILLTPLGDVTPVSRPPAAQPEPETVAGEEPVVEAGEVEEAETPEEPVAEAEQQEEKPRRARRRRQQAEPEAVAEPEEPEQPEGES